MKRTIEIQLINGTVLQEEVPAEGKDKSNEEVLARVATYFAEATANDINFCVFAGQLIAIDKVVEAYVQES